MSAVDTEAAAAGALAHPDCNQFELGAVLHALSDPVRLQIVATLANGEELPCSALELPVSKSTCTHHFKVLREAGVLSQRVVGTMRLNSLRRDDLDRCFPGLIDAVISSAPAPSSARR